MTNSSVNGGPIDKEEQYGEFLAREREGRRFLHRVACKAVDIAPEDDVNITTNKTGIGGGTLLGCVGLASAAACAIAYMLSGNPAPTAAPPNYNYGIEVLDQDGKPFDAVVEPTE